MPTVKTGTVVVLAALLGFGVTGCTGDDGAPSGDGSGVGSSAAEQVKETPEPVDLTGEWTQTNSKTDDSYQMATITGEQIEVYWVSDGGDTRSLYWAGTVDVAEDEAESFSWDSVNDTSKTETALLASSDETKTFTYQSDELSYDVTALGTTMTVRLGRE